jgi:signal transduction histidine kinase/CheY-like chemotaxis protein
MQGVALILTRHGRDAEVAAAILAEGGVASHVCPDVHSLVERLGDDIGFVVAAEEALLNADLRGLGRWVESQPEWSDLPFIVLTRHGGGLERNPMAARTSELLGNVNFLERPFHPTTFLSMTRSALRSRQRQYEMRAHHETLEQRVAAQIAQRQRAEEQLRQAQKVEMLGQLTGGVAHDFNNLLMVVMVNLELLGRLVTGNSTAKQLIDAAMQSTKRGAALTQRLLAFSHRQELSVASYDLAALITDMRDLLQRSLGSTYRLRLTLPEGLPPAYVDANQIELAILNLVINARDAMPEGGELHIELFAGRPPSVLGDATDSFLCIAVTDRGRGMDAETLRRATEPFFSTKPQGKGTGLGLSMIDGLARQLGGTLKLESDVGRGTRAELWLPVAPSEAPTMRTRVLQQAHEPEPMEPLNVLLVDDDPSVAEGTRGLLESLGHQVTTADSGAVALQLVDGKRPPDVVITDYAMPSMTGAQLARELHSRYPGLPIILATGYAEFPPEQEIDLPRLTKPYERRALADQLRRVVQH